MDLNNEIYVTSDETFRENTVMLKLFGIPFYLICLGIFSKITMELTGTGVLITPISWVFDMGIFYLWHVHAHYRINSIPFNSIAHQVHNDHHYVDFPPKYFWGSPSPYGSMWRNRFQPGKSEPFDIYDWVDSINTKLANEFFAISLYVLVTLGKRFIWGLDWTTILATVVQSFLVLEIGNYLHMSFHTKDHWLAKYKIWRELRYLHYLHHCADTKRNYMVFAFIFDKVFGTYVKTNTLRKKAE